MESISWRALHTQGHDAARLEPCAGGFQLTGHAIFLKDGAQADLHYRLALADSWSTRSGSVQGSVGDRAVAVEIERNGACWMLNGRTQPRVEGLLDLDFGFTPATNCPQLRRLDLAIGQAAEIVVAWFDAESEALKPLVQRYRRTEALAYAYESPEHGYAETLRLAPSGFVIDYPGLWEATR